MKKNLPQIILMLILAILIVIPFFNHEPSVVKKGVSSTQEKSLVKNNHAFEKEIQLYQKQNDSLQTLAFSNQKALQKAKQKSNVLENRILLLTEKIKENESRDSLPSDSLQDSLMQSTLDFIAESKRKDTLCDSTIYDLVGMLDKKNSMLRSYKSKVSEMENLSLQNDELKQELSDSEQRLKKKTLANKILYAGLLLLSGISLASLIH